MTAGRLVARGAFTPAARAVALEATGGRCARCGTADAIQVHHRAPRRMGGVRRPAIGEPHNAVPLCLADHAWCESNRDEARALGWLLHEPDPSAPFWTVQWGWRAWVYYDGDWLHAAVAPPA